MQGNTISKKKAKEIIDKSFPGVYEKQRRLAKQQEQKKDQKSQKQEQKQQQEEKQQQQAQSQEQQQQQEQRQDQLKPKEGMTKEDAERILNALKDDEKDVLKKQKRFTQTQGKRGGKDW